MFFARIYVFLDNSAKLDFGSGANPGFPREGRQPQRGSGGAPTYYLAKFS